MGEGWNLAAEALCFKDLFIYSCWTVSSLIHGSEGLVAWAVFPVIDRHRTTVGLVSY